MELGATAESAEGNEGGVGLRVAPTDSRVSSLMYTWFGLLLNELLMVDMPLTIKVFYTAEELRSFRTLGLDPSQSSQHVGRVRKILNDICSHQVARIQEALRSLLRGQHQAFIIHLPGRDGQWPVIGSETPIHICRRARHTPVASGLSPHYCAL